MGRFSVSFDWPMNVIYQFTATPDIRPEARAEVIARCTSILSRADSEPAPALSSCQLLPSRSASSGLVGSFPHSFQEPS